MPSDVAGVRNEIEALIGQGQATVPDATLQNWVSRLHRDPPISNRHSSPSMTAEIAEEIRTLHGRGMNHSQIAAELGINHGRVSEVLTRKKW
jgi:DNA-binding NarL/FixJ family response regulator